MQDIDRISKDLILPSLSMTKSSSFAPSFQQQMMSFQSPLENPLKAAGTGLMAGKMMDTHDNPYVNPASYTS
jgi:hypothetical protein